ncbi:MAG: hypothetical protein WC501_02505 [Candidatus Micrarchaeia archaeon]
MEDWKVKGEAITEYGEIILYENIESLEGKIKQNRPKYMNMVLSKEDKKEIIKVFPKKCKNCKFSKFFGIRVLETSLGSGIDIFCPNCKKKLKEIENNW